MSAGHLHNEVNVQKLWLRPYCVSASVLVLKYPNTQGRETNNLPKVDVQWHNLLCSSVINHCVAERAVRVNSHYLCSMDRACALVMTRYQDFNFDTISIRFCKISTISIRYRYFVNNK